MATVEISKGLSSGAFALNGTEISIEEAFEISVPFNANAPEDSPFDISTVATMIAAVDQLRRAQG